MQEKEIRAALVRHWATSTGGAQDAEYDIYHDNVIVDYPQSGERIHGKHNIQALRSHHPAKPSGFEVRRMLGNGDLWITEYVITYDNRSAYTVSIMEFNGDKVSHETQYFADPFAAPEWRAQWVEQASSTSAGV
ncbi:MAG: nuclear transport factor 2 family protein [Blastocatellia bacterium]